MTQRRISHTTTDDVHAGLRQLTTARIAIGRSGGSLTTNEVLDFAAAHAAARDAVHQEFQAAHLANEIRRLDVDVIHATTRASTTDAYLARPDWGRQLSDESRSELAQLNASPNDLAIIASNGLSATAAHRQVTPLLATLLPILRERQWKLAPIVVVTNGRVALQDEIGQALHSRIALMLVGERPGLGSADSLGAYLVYGPQPGRTDADRNCVSNIRDGGLSANRAADTIAYLLNKAKSLQLSGIELKDDREDDTLPPPSAARDDKHLT